MSRRAELEFLDAISAYFHHATPGLGPDVETDQNVEWGLRQRDKAVRGDALLRRRSEDAAIHCWSCLFDADITLIAGLIFADVVKLPLPSECDMLRDWYAAMQRRPSVRDRVTISAPGE